MEKTAIELFAGVGGFRVGLNHIKSFNLDTGLANEKKDWNFVWANQFEPSTKKQDAFDCYERRFGKGEISNEDISKVNKNKIPNHNLLTGGFPCQDYSVARTSSNEKGIEGKKGVLFWEIVDILKAKNTPFVLLENVDRLIKSPAKQRGRDFAIMLKTFNNLGYSVEWRIVNAAEYGFAQRRRRIYIFAWKNNTKYGLKHNENFSTLQSNYKQYFINEGFFSKSFPIGEIEKSSIISLVFYKDLVDLSQTFSGEFLNAGIMTSGIVSTYKVTPKLKKYTTLREIQDTNTNLEKYLLTDKQIEKFEYLRGSKKILRTRSDGTEYYYTEGKISPYDSLDLPGRTMLTSEGSINRSTHILLDEKMNKLRFLTPIEAERLQSFPDNWTNSGMGEKRRYFMMGNALVTSIISTVEPILSKIIEDEN